jgi:hypothetical protein
MKLYNKLFTTKEFRSIIGKGWQNFWILFLVFLLTIFALEFSRSGLKYLSYKMSDPFINWIEVKEQGDFQRFMEDIEKQKSDFSISTVEANNYILEYIFNNDFKKIRVEGRTIAHDSKLFDKILDSENAIIVRQRVISQNDYGWIVTKDLMTRLGYEDETHYPLFINYTFPGDTANLNHFGIKNFNDYFKIPIPVIAVVNQLPDLLDFITPTYFMQQNTSGSHPFNISTHEEYYQDLVLAIENSDEEIEKEIRSKLDNSGVQYDYDWEKGDYELALRSATKYRIIIRDSLVQRLNAVAEEISSELNIYRIYDYDFDEGYQLRANYLSFMFTDLSKVPDFAKWSKEEHGIRIDMTQIEAKENFNIFNILAWSLCIAISIIAIVFIAIFLYFLIDSHFHRISKNLGTIMAFGLSNSAIIKIYLTVFLGLIFTSLVTVVIVLFVGEYLCNFLQWTREGGLPYFSIRDGFVLAIIGVLPVISAIVTVIFLNFKLKATPGDLIFGRNN